MSTQPPSTKPRSHSARPQKTEVQGGAALPDFRRERTPSEPRLTALPPKLHRVLSPLRRPSPGLREPGGAEAPHPGRGSTCVGRHRGWGRDLCWSRRGLGRHLGWEPGLGWGSGVGLGRQGLGAPFSALSEVTGLGVPSPPRAGASLALHLPFSHLCASSGHQSPALPSGAPPAGGSEGRWVHWPSVPGQELPTTHVGSQQLVAAWRKGPN